MPGGLTSFEQPILLALYGVLSADVEVWSLIEHQLLPSTCTVSIYLLRSHLRISSHELDGSSATTP